MESALLPQSMLHMLHTLPQTALTRVEVALASFTIILTIIPHHLGQT
jgi:hypothetical protein